MRALRIAANALVGFVLGSLVGLVLVVFAWAAYVFRPGAI